MPKYKETNLEWRKKKQKILKLAGKAGSDALVAEMCGSSKSTVQGIRRTHGIPAFTGKRGPKKKASTLNKDALARGYPNATVAALWEETRETQELLSKWTRGT